MDQARSVAESLGGVASLPGDKIAIAPLDCAWLHTLTELHWQAESAIELDALHAESIEVVIRRACFLILTYQCRLLRF